jgi:hypothetical protein
MDPRRADRLRHPAVRLYGEYILGYVAAIRRAPLPPAERRECYRYLAQWVTSRALGRRAGQAQKSASSVQSIIAVDTAGADRKGKLS